MRVQTGKALHLLLNKEFYLIFERCRSKHSAQWVSTTINNFSVLYFIFSENFLKSVKSKYSLVL